MGDIQTSNQDNSNRLTISSKTLHPPPSTLQPTPSNLHPPTSTLQPPPSNLQPPPSNLHPPTSTLHRPTYTLQPPTSNFQPQPSTLNQDMIPRLTNRRIFKNTQTCPRRQVVGCSEMRLISKRGLKGRGRVVNNEPCVVKEQLGRQSCSIRSAFM